MKMYKIVANWKMYLTVRESRDLAAKLASWWEKQPCEQAQLVLFPSNLALADVRGQVMHTTIKLGSQELSLSPKLGAFTGQAAAQQVKEIGATHVLLGHSEQRQFWHISDAMVRQQMETAIGQKLHAILCVGETAEERAARRTDSVIVSQLHGALEGLQIPDGSLTIAYEPRWAIGTGKPVDPGEAGRVHQLISHTLREFTEAEVPVLYGGSVDAENALSFLQQPEVHGLLIGSASTKPDSLHALIQLIHSNVCQPGL